MFGEINKYYSGQDATIEILIMLIFSFLLGFLLSYLIFYQNSGKNIKKYKKKKENIVSKYKIDNLKIIIGLGGKVEKILNKHNIYTFKDLSESKISNLIKILEKQGKKDKNLYVKTWPDQARLAYKKKWGELKEYQELLEKSKKKKKKSK